MTQSTIFDRTRAVSSRGSPRPRCDPSGEYPEKAFVTAQVYELSDGRSVEIQHLYNPTTALAILVDPVGGQRMPTIVKMHVTEAEAELAVKVGERLMPALPGVLRWLAVRWRWTARLLKAYERWAQERLALKLDYLPEDSGMLILQFTPGMDARRFLVSDRWWRMSLGERLSAAARLAVELAWLTPYVYATRSYYHLSLENTIIQQDRSGYRVALLHSAPSTRTDNMRPLDALRRYLSLVAVFVLSA